jgi:3-oxoacyl-[acyl-carrier-protein] synthase II
MRRVVITGVGAVTPCGADAETSFRNVVAGQSGIDRIQGFDCTEYASQIAGECRDFKAEDYIEKKRVREMARFIHFAVAASEQAVRAARFEPTAEAKDRVGTFIGVGFCGLETFEATHKTLMEKGPNKVSPYFIPATISNLAPGQVSMRFGFRGPSYTNTSACSSGAHSIGEAFKWIQRGGIDAAVAGGAEAAVAPTGVAGFCAMRALSKRNDEPKRASRPFDKGRDGFVIGEGAGVMLLEERESAIRRGAPILAEIVGYGTTADAYHLTQPAPGGEGAVRAMRLALEDAGAKITDVDYVNAHGTSTPTGDMQELMAIRTVFGDHATNGLLISSTKSMTGHLLGAAGGLEAVFTAQAIASGKVPPTINLDDPEEGTEGLDLVPHVAREKALRYAISNSFGFGGTNVTLVLKRHEV